MKNNIFRYTPRKLIETNKNIKEKFPSSQEVTARKASKYENINLNQLLEKLRITDINNIKKIARVLKAREVYYLVFNYNHIENELLDKVNIILFERMKKRFVKLMWDNFNNDYLNTYITNFFQQTKDKIKSYGFKESPYIYLDEIFNDKPVKWIASEVHNIHKSYYKGVDYFRINKKSILAEEIAFRIFTIPEKKVFKREEEKELSEIISSLTMAKFKEVTENYLEIHTIDEFNPNYMNLLKERLGDPTEEYGQSWRDISSEARNKARSWFNTQELKDFFANIDEDDEEARRRFSYWKKYIDSTRLQKAKQVASKKQLFLIFKNIVVIEFGDKGNAAYAYSRDFFENRFAKYMYKGNYVNNGALKIKIKKVDSDNRIEHRDSGRIKWEAKADEKIDFWLRRGV